MVIVQQLVNGITLGMVYALIAVGYSLVFGILRLLNMAHGAVYAFGVHMVVLFLGIHFGLWPAVLLSIAATGILSMLIDSVVLRPLRVKKSAGITHLISVIGVSYIIQNGMLVYFGSQRRSFPRLIELGNVEIGGIIITGTQLLIIVVSMILLVLLMLLINKTKIGLAMRGTESNMKAATLMGINVKRVITFTFFLGGISAAVAGILIASYYEMSFPTMGADAGMKAFAAAVLGGIGVLHGSVFGGILVGVSEAMAVHFFGAGFRDAFAFVILVLVLLIRPSGIFGKPMVTKV